MVLLKPTFLSFKNSISTSRNNILNHYSLVILLAFIFMSVLYQGTCSFLTIILKHPETSNTLPFKLISFALLAFFILLILSNMVSAFGYLFAANDTNFFLSMPISSRRFYAKRLIEVIISSIWIFTIFALPALIAYIKVFNLPWHTLLQVSFVCIPFLIIPAALSTIVATFFVPLIKLFQIKEFFLFLIIVCIFTLAIGIPNFSILMPTHKGSSIQDLATLLIRLEDPHPIWLPSKWIADLIVSILGQQPINFAQIFLIISTTLAILFCGYLVFDGYFFKNWSDLSSKKTSTTVENSQLERSLAKFIFPFNAPLRAIVLKDFHTLIRDPSQSIQLIILLGLTLIYLYNFKSLNDIPVPQPEIYSWWQSLLCITNVAMGACVVATIATRFVYPTVSLEGRAYWTIRCAPLTINEYLKNKFKSLISPIIVISLVIFSAGAMAINLPAEALLLSALSAIALSISIVGLGLGIGASYAKFDWETPTELTSNLGSLVYSLLIFTLISISLIPVSFITIFSCVKDLNQFVNNSTIITIKIVSYISLFLINIIATNKTLKLGLRSLENLER